MWLVYQQCHCVLFMCRSVLENVGGGVDAFVCILGWILG